MKTNLIFSISTFLILIGSGSAFSQKEDFEEKSEKVKAAKVAFITNRLNLTSAQAEKFWPVFNEFETEKRKIRKQLRGFKNDKLKEDASEEQYKVELNKMFALRQEELNLEKSYSEKFLKVISARQLVDLFKSESEFTRMLLQ
jgi:hypothetical protein